VPGAGALCVGVSGAGKTTLARAFAALPGTLVLSDERSLARPEGQSWVLDGTPWHGDGGFAVRATVPLTAVLVLEQAHEDCLAPLTPARAMASIFRCVFRPLWRPDNQEQVLSTLEQLVRRVPCYALRNQRGGRAPLLVSALLAGAAREDR
jgi:hypothetical protein